MERFSAQSGALDALQWRNAGSRLRRDDERTANPQGRFAPLQALAGMAAILFGLVLLGCCAHANFGEADARFALFIALTATVLGLAAFVDLFGGSPGAAPDSGADDERARD